MVSAQAATPSCVRLEAMPRWGAGAYDHWLRVTNGCERRVRCEVSTDVNPEPVRVELAPEASQELLTFRGSPARTFTPRAVCEELER